jgi:hypothetical protein
LENVAIGLKPLLMKIIGFTWLKSEHNILKYSSFYMYSNNKDHIVPLLTILIEGGRNNEKSLYWEM